MGAPHYADETVALHHQPEDGFSVLASLPDASVDAIVTDPPYGLEFMGKAWDGADGFRRSLNPADVGRDNPFGRTSRTSPEYRAGSLFQAWCELWAAECLRVLKPGGHMLAFGGTRTWHRLACAVEDAGFEVRDSIAWMYGSGFPKSLDVSKAIDKAQRRHYVLAAVGLGLEIPGNNLHDWTKAEHSPGDAWWERFKAHLSPEEWQRLERAVVGNGTSGATAGMQLLGPSGIKGGEFDITAPATDAARTWQGWGTALKPAFEPIVVARKPLVGTVAANVLAHGTGALNIDGCRVDGGARPLRVSNRKDGNNVYSEGLHGSLADGATSLGRWPANVILDEDQAAALDEQSGTLTSGKESRDGHIRRGDANRTVYGGYDGQSPGDCAGALYGDSGGASRFFYVAKADASERVRVNGTAHPTVKPLTLMRWLVRLVTPPGGVVLEPFAGSGTTVEACILEGFQCVAIEREADYLPLIVQRINRRRDPVAAVKATGDDGGLFDLFDEESA